MTEHIGIYRVERPIGRGGMGEVFLAWDDRLERRVAVKRIRRDAGLSPEQRERFRREARLAARLSHSAVVQIYDLATEDGDDAIVMEYVEGRTLAERLADGPLDLAEALRLAQEIAQGLAAAHEAGLIHRDLKAANVIVTPAGHAKILDFGLARPAVRSAEEPLTRQGFVIGTFHAMSPEQARGEEVDQRSDLFSLGILLYEMLTGQTPFRGADPAETLKRIVQEPPPDPRTLRPDLPPQVESLLLRLLAKERENRPDDAEEVATLLERLRTGSGSLLRADEASVSDLPTAQVPVDILAPLSSRKEPLPSSLVGPVRWSGRRPWIAATAAVLLGALAATLYLKWPSAAPLRIAVSPTVVIPSNDERLSVVGSGVLTATLAGITNLKGLAAIDPQEAARGGRSLVAMAKATAAEEVLTSEVRREGQLARIILRRLQGSDGSVLWTETLQVSMDPDGLHGLVSAVAIKLQKAYPGHDLRPGVPELDVRDQDYATFLEIKQRVDSGTVPPGPELARLEEIVRSSPRFLEAWILAARLAQLRFLSQGEVADLDRAAELARRAKELSAEDPRPLRLELNIALAANDTEKAEEILARIEELLSGNPELLVLRARLADRQGRIDDAAEFQTDAAEKIPSWQNLFYLADLEARRGHIAEARGSIEEILRQDSGNLSAKEALAHIELLYGDLNRAEKIYQGCVSLAPRRILNNLGFAQFLRGHYQEAAETYRRALAINPDHVITLVELANTEIELGRTHEAETLYRRALARLEENEKIVRLSPADAMRKALCLVRLDRPREAVELAQAQLRRTSGDPELLQQSALVHTIAGERVSAINNALDALDKGLHPRFFSASAFRSLLETPEIRSRLAPPPSS